MSASPAAPWASSLLGFWHWWAGECGTVVEAVDGGRTDDAVIRNLLDRIAAIGLSCELGPGMTSRHALCVSANGDPALRKRAYRWFDAAPPADEAFEFHPARIAGPSGPTKVLMLGGEEFAFSDFRFDVRVDEHRQALDLDVQHPAFPGVDVDIRAQVGFLALDNILGEEEVERWIGALEWSGEPPAASAGPQDLRGHVERLSATVPSGEWAVLQGEDAIVVAARPLRPVDHPYFDELCRLTATAVEGGLGELQGSEEELGVHFGARAFHAASLTSNGERTAFVYVDREESTSTELGAWASAHGYAFACSHDPAWEAIRSFR